MQLLYESSVDPDFMNNIFKLRNTDKPTREKYKLSLKIPKLNEATFGTRSIRRYGPKIWNALPYKSSENLTSFKTIIKRCDGDYCTCRVCEHAFQDDSKKQKFNAQSKFVRVNLSWLVIIIRHFFFLYKVLKIYSFIRGYSFLSYVTSEQFKLGVAKAFPSHR